MSILPENIMKMLDTEFKTRQSMAVAMELLTAWTKMPSWKEKETIGERHGRNVRTVHDICKKLQELELFTADEGSMPLLRLRLEKQQTKTSEVKDISDETEITEKKKIMTELPKFSPMGVPLEDDPETPAKSPSEETPDDFGALQNKVFRMEIQLNGLDKKLDSIIPTIQGLSAKTPETPEQPFTPPIPQTEKSDVKGSESVEDLVKRTVVETFNKMQTDNPANPEVAVADVEDVILPSMDLEKENPLEDMTGDIIELESTIISTKKVGFTPKSLLLFDLARKKGFRGNFADFVNSSITSATKRGRFKLVVEEDVE